MSDIYPLRSNRKKLVPSRNFAPRFRFSDHDAFLAQASKFLSTSLDYQTTLKNLSRIAVPYMSDWCVIDLVEGGGYRRFRVVHTDPDKQRLSQRLVKFPPDPKKNIGIHKVLRTGHPLIVKKVTDTWLKAVTKNQEHLSVVKKLGFESFLCVPLIARGSILGSISFISAHPKRVFNEEDLKLAIDFANLAAVAVDTARLVTTLQAELTERKFIEAQLQNQKDQLNIILQNVADGITVQDQTGNVIYANEAAAIATGHSHPVFLLNTPPKEILEQFEIFDEAGSPFNPNNLPGRLVLAGKEEAEALINFRNKRTQQERWSIVKSRPVWDENGKVLYAINIFHDITARKELEAQKDEFLAIASHELKTPITSAKAFLQIAQARIKKGDYTELQNFFSKIEQQHNKLIHLINDLLDVTRIETGKLELHLLKVNIVSLVRETVDSLQTISGRHTLIFEAREALISIMIDSERIAQVLNNLILNAIKYSPSGKKVVIRIKRKKGEVVISVQDFGRGISQENIKKIFDRFFRIEDKQQRIVPGLGLGLYISYEIIKLHHGKIWVESEMGKGSTFFFSLPLK